MPTAQQYGSLLAVALVLGAPVLAVASCIGCDETADPVVAACKQAGEGELASAHNVTVRRGTRVNGERAFDGEIAPCTDVQAATALSIALETRATLPRAVQPGQFDVDLDPELAADQAPLLVVEAHVASRSLLVDSHALASIDRTIWLHELAHLSTSGARPTRRRGKRLFAAIDEGVADFIAASASGSSRLGTPGAEARDVDAPPVVEDTEWVALDSRRDAAFEPHRMGAGLAAALHAREPLPGPLLEDVRAALADDTPYPRAATPRALIAALLSRCPERSRATFAEALQDWLPEPLLPEDLAHDD